MGTIYGKNNYLIEIYERGKLKDFYFKLNWNKNISKIIDEVGEEEYKKNIEYYHTSIAIRELTVYKFLENAKKNLRAKMPKNWVGKISNVELLRAIFYLSDYAGIIEDLDYCIINDKIFIQEENGILYLNFNNKYKNQIKKYSNVIIEI
jgi:hypothetical protein